MSIIVSGRKMFDFSERRKLRQNERETKKKKTNQSPDPLQSPATVEGYAVNDAWTGTRKVSFMHMQQQSKSGTLQKNVCDVTELTSILMCCIINKKMTPI